MTILVVLFWVWVAVSCVLFIRRRVTGPRRADQHPAEMVPTGAAASEATSQRSSAPAAPSAQPVVRPVHPAPTPSPVAVMAGAVSLTDALSGMAMPCDLVPLTQRVADAFDPGRITLATDTAPAEAVLSELASELRRLGYSVHVADPRVHAQRESVALTATVTERLDDQPEASVVVELALG